MKKTILGFIITIATIGLCPVCGQVPVTYHNLVLEGGGIRGIAYSGALVELENQGVLDSIVRVGGTSAGAIQAALLAVGYSAKEITALTYQMPVKKMNDGRYIFIGGFRRLMKNYGWYRGEAFTRWMEAQIKAKAGNADLTLGELHQRADTSRCRDLYVTGTNLSRQRAEVFSYETHPNLKISDAVRISMSIPLYYRAVSMDSTGTIIRKPKRGQRADVLVDGGILANYPINLFDQNHYLSKPQTEFSDEACIFNPETLGLRLDRPEQISYDAASKGLAPYPILNFKNYISAFYTILHEQVNRYKLQPEDWQRTVSISTLDFGPKVKHLSKMEKKQLIESGQTATKAFLEK